MAYLRTYLLSSRHLAPSPLKNVGGLVSVILWSYNERLPGQAGKRKLDFDSSTVETLAREAEEAALRLIEREQAEALRHKLPDFWLPSLTPTYTSNGPPSSLKDVKVQTMCRGGEPPHAIKWVSLSRIHEFRLISYLKLEVVYSCSVFLPGPFECTFNRLDSCD